MLTPTPANESGRRVRRAISAVGGAIVVVIALTGCSPASTIRAREVGGQVEFLVCEDLDVRKLTVRSAGPDQGVNYQVRWTASGSSVLAAGDVIAYGEPPPGMETSIAAAAIDSSAEAIYIAIEELEETHAAAFAADSLGPEWVDVNGRVVDDQNPCR